MAHHSFTQRLTRALRNFATAPQTAGELLAQLSGWVAQLEAEAAAVTPHDFGQTEVPLSERGKRKWYRTPRDIQDVDTLMVHTSGVDGGFGVRPYQWKSWLGVWDDLVRQGRTTTDPGWWKDASRGQLMAVVPEGVDPAVARLEWAKSLALLTRYLGVPYHYISAPNSVLVRNHRLTVTTWHGHQNRNTAGWGIDDVWDPGEMPEAKALDYRRDFHEIVADMRAQGAPLVKVKAHAQTSRQRGRDPGEDIWAKVVRPEMDRLELVFDSTIYGSGRPLRSSWWAAPVWPAQG